MKWHNTSRETSVFYLPGQYPLERSVQAPYYSSLAKPSWPAKHEVGWPARDKCHPTAVQLAKTLSFNTQMKVSCWYGTLDSDAEVHMSNYAQLASREKHLDYFFSSHAAVYHMKR
jgi:hypothetical protein